MSCFPELLLVFSRFHVTPQAVFDQFLPSNRIISPIWAYLMLFEAFFDFKGKFRSSLSFSAVYRSIFELLGLPFAPHCILKNFSDLPDSPRSNFFEFPANFKVFLQIFSISVQQFPQNPNFCTLTSSFHAKFAAQQN